MGKQIHIPLPKTFPKDAVGVGVKYHHSGDSQIALTMCIVQWSDLSFYPKVFGEVGEFAFRACEKQEYKKPQHVLRLL
jgi:hypothetical protein